jgi:hypothetical protein
MGSERPDEPYLDDPDWLLARASYVYPDADDPTGRLVLRIEAAREIRAIEARYAR